MVLILASALLALANADRRDVEERLRKSSVEELISLGAKAVAQLGTYQARLTKQERVGGKLLDPQTLEITVREKPLAARIKFIAGPAKGRKLLYNVEMRRDEMRVRESGLLGLFAIWISLDSPMTRKDTNHRVTDLGFGPLLEMIRRDVEQAKAQGGFARADEGFDERGAFCMRYTAPPGAKGLRGDKTRICVDAALGLPMRVEVFAGGQLAESYAYEEVVAQKRVTADFFTPDAAGL